jgi:hypothetical protein
MIACYHGRVSDVYALVRSIRDQQLSRNRHFDEHATVNGAEARRVHRFLRAIERDLLAAAEIEVEREADSRWRISMRFPSVRLRRMVSLSEGERAILVENPRVAALLAAETGRYRAAAAAADSGNR